MKKVILLLMLLLPMGVGLQSCGDDDELSYYDQVLEAKIQMVNEFKDKYKNELFVSIRVGGTIREFGESPKNIEIVDGRFLTIRNFVLDLMKLTGYTKGYYSEPYGSYTDTCLLIFE